MKKSRNTINKIRQSAKWLNSHMDSKIPKMKTTYRELIKMGEEQMSHAISQRPFSELYDRAALKTTNHRDKALEDAKESKRQRHKNGPTGNINPKEKTSLLKIIYGLVKKHYKYDPTQERNADTSIILKAIEQAGLKIDRGVLKKVLDEAHELEKSE
jgi:hypothetical protein